MAYLNLHLDYFDHPKTKRLIGLLGKGAEVIPIRVWAYCGKYHARDGKLAGYSAQEIESVIGWWGDQGRAVDALLKVGFLHSVEDGFVVHDWLEHEGHIIAFKEKARANAQKRWGAGSNANSIAPALPVLPVSISHTLSKQLWELILKRNPSHKPPDLQKWSEEMRKIIEIDKRQEQDIAKVIVWCQADGFWQNNILSPAKLRKQFDQLFLKMQGNGGKPATDATTAYERTMACCKKHGFKAESIEKIQEDIRERVKKALSLMGGVTEFGRLDEQDGKFQFFRKWKEAR